MLHALASLCTSFGGIERWWWLACWELPKLVSVAMLCPRLVVSHFTGGTTLVFITASVLFFFFNVCCCSLDNLSITPIHGYIYLMWTEFTEVSHWHKNNNTKTNVVVITNYCRALLIHLFTYFFTFVINEYTFGNALYVNGHYMLHNRKMVENHC